MVTLLGDTWPHSESLSRFSSCPTNRSSFGCAHEARVGTENNSALWRRPLKIHTREYCTCTPEYYKWPFRQASRTRATRVTAPSEGVCVCVFISYLRTLRAWPLRKHSDTKVLLLYALRVGSCCTSVYSSSRSLPIHLTPTHRSAGDIGLRNRPRPAGQETDPSLAPVFLTVGRHCTVVSYGRNVPTVQYSRPSK